MNANLCRTKKLFDSLIIYTSFFIPSQAGLALSTPTSIAVEQVIDISNSEQCLPKNTVQSSQQSITTKTSNIGQLTSTPTSMYISLKLKNNVLNSILLILTLIFKIFREGPTSIIATIQQQQQPCGQSPRLQQASAMGIPRHHLEYAAPRIALTTTVQDIVTSSSLGSQIVNSHVQTAQNVMPTSSPTKEVNALNKYVIFSFTKTFEL